MVTHEMDVIESICDHVAVMEAGKVIEQGSTIDILVILSIQQLKTLYKLFYISSYQLTF